MAHDVFISYSSKDKATADAACAVLEQRGLRCWMAPRDILPGADWGEAIIDGINAARVLVLVFSGHANASPQIKREVERAVSKGLPIIPVRIEEVAPVKALEYFISTPHWLDAFTPPLERHLSTLAGVVEQLVRGGGTPAAPAPPPLSVRRLPALDRRRLLWIGAGAAGFVAASAALGLRPARPPRFTGSWVTERVSLLSPATPVGATSFASDVFARAALQGPDVEGQLAINDLGQYTYVLTAEDRGGLTLSGDQLTATSDVTKTPSTFATRLLAPSQAASITAGIGGKPGDFGLLLSGQPPVQPSLFAGTPATPGSTESLAAVAGTWRVDLAPSGVLPEIHVTFEIGADGRYRFRGQTREAGLWRAAEGAWTRTPQSGPADSGTYTFDGRDRLTTAGAGGTMVWRRTA